VKNGFRYGFSFITCGGYLYPPMGRELTG